MIGDQGAVAAGQPTDFLDGDIVVSFFVKQFRSSIHQPLHGFF